MHHNGGCFSVRSCVYIPKGDVLGFVAGPVIRVIGRSELEDCISVGVLIDIL